MNMSYIIKIMGTISVVLSVATVSLSCTDKDTGMLTEQDFEKPIYNPEENANQEVIKETVRVFEEAKEGYHSYRIPSLTVAPNGDLIAMADGRKLTSLDYGDIDIVAKVSSDRGKTWSALKVVVSEGEGTWGNPTVVTDYINNRIWLFMSWNSDSHSQNGGSFNGKNYPAVTEWGQRRVFT